MNLLVVPYQIIFLTAFLALSAVSQPSFNAPSANCRSYRCKGGKKYFAVQKGKSKFKSTGCKYD